MVAGIETEDGTYRGGPIVGSGKFMPEFANGEERSRRPAKGGHPNVHYTVGATGDRPRGRSNRRASIHGYKKAALAVDAGRAINPRPRRRARSPAASCKAWPLSLYEMTWRFDDGRASCSIPPSPTTRSRRPRTCPDEVIPIIVEVASTGRSVRSPRGGGAHDDRRRSGSGQRRRRRASGIRITSMPITAGESGPRVVWTLEERSMSRTATRKSRSSDGR